MALRTEKQLNTLVEERVPSDLLERLPVPVDKIANCLGVKHILIRPLDVSALLVPLENDRGFVIAINESDNLERQRFSIAHEVAHILLSTGCNDIKFRGLVAQAAEESICNELAAELLMPRDKFKRLASSYLWSVTSINKLATQFQVSLQASARRLAELAPERIYAHFWGLRGERKQVKLLWAEPHPSKTNASPITALRNRSSPVPEAFHSKGIRRGQMRFQFLRGQISVAKEIYTEAIGLGNARNRYVLSFSYPEQKKLPI